MPAEPVRILANVPNHTESVAAEARRELILRTAARLFQRGGFRGTSVTRIAEECGMTPANLYWYFPSKQKILEAALVELYRRSYQALIEVDDASRTASHRLEDFVRAFVRFQLADSGEEANFGYIALQSSLEPSAREEIRKWERTHRGLIKDILGHGMRSGEFSIVDVSVAASMILTSVEYVFLWFHPGGRLSIAEVAEEYAQLALRMVVTHAAD